MYFVSLGHSGTLGLNSYMQLEGFAYRLVPIKTVVKNSALDAGRIDTDIMYENMMHKFTWGRMNEPDVLIEYYHTRNFSVMQIRNKFLRLADELAKEDKKEKAIEVLDKVFEIMPDNKVQYDYFNLQMIGLYYELGANEKADKQVEILYESLTDLLDYFVTFNAEDMNSITSELRMDMGLLNQLEQICRYYKSTELSEKIKLKMAEYRI